MSGDVTQHHNESAVHPVGEMPPLCRYWRNKRFVKLHPLEPGHSWVVGFPFLFCGRSGHIKVKVILDHYLQGEAYLELFWYLQFYSSFIWATSPSHLPSLFSLCPELRIAFDIQIQRGVVAGMRCAILKCGENYAKSFLKAKDISESGGKRNGCG